MFTYSRFPPVPLLLILTLHCQGSSQYHRSSNHRPSSLPIFLLPRDLYFSRPLFSLLSSISSTCDLRCVLYFSAIITTLTNSVDQSPSREANSRSASQEIPCILWNPTIQYSVHKNPSLLHVPPPCGATVQPGL